MDAFAPVRLSSTYARCCFGPIALTASYTAPCTMPMLIENAGGAPPFGPGRAPSVVVATWFQWVTSLASVPVGAAADAPDTPSAPRRAPTATVVTATVRLRDIALSSPSTRPEVVPCVASGRVLQDESVQPVDRAAAASVQ